jgi:Domain of unknown function (DUF4328)
MQAQNATQYRSPRVLGYLTMFFLGSLFVTNLLSTISGFGEIFLPFSLDLDGGEYISIWFLIIGLISILEVFLYLATVVFFLIWLFRVYTNLSPLRSPNQEFTPGWAVGWWFIPFANLVKPYQVVREAWQESDPDFDPSLNFLSNTISAPTFLGFWWAFWILSNIFNNIASRMINNDGQAIQGFGVVIIIASILSMIASMLAILVVKTISARQDARYQNLYKLQVFSPPTPPNFNQTNFNQPNQNF